VPSGPGHLILEDHWRRIIRCCSSANALARDANPARPLRFGSLVPAGLLSVGRPHVDGQLSGPYSFVSGSGIAQRSNRKLLRKGMGSS
jgi:hypothetical protein